MNGNSHLYRHFGDNNQLLYVGVSLSALTRLQQHKKHSGWFDEIAKVTVEKFDSRDAALKAEAEAIQKERPLYNVQKKQPPPPPVTKAEESKNQLIRSVTFRPIYTLGDVGEVLRKSSATVSSMIKAGEIGHVIVGSRRYITGWQLIEYIEHLEAALHG